MKIGTHIRFLLIVSFFLAQTTASVLEGAPILFNIETKSLVFTAGSDPVIITKSIDIYSDNWFSRIRSATIRIDGYNADEDVLSYQSIHEISGFWDAKTGVLTLSGSSRVSEYRDALRNISYSNRNTFNPSTAERTISFVVSDGQSNSNVVYRNIEIDVPNTAPQLSDIELPDLKYCPGSVATVTLSISIEDQNNQNLASAMIKISNGYVANEDFLRFTNQNGITGTWDNASGTMTLTGISTIANYQEALRSIRYESDAMTDPATGFHEISFVVNDGIFSSNTVSRMIDHAAPTATLSGNISICSGTEGTLNVVLTGTAPWSYSYKINNGNPIVVANVSASPHILKVNKQGTYTLTAVSDQFCNGTASGSGLVSYLIVPDVQLNGLEPVYSKQSTEWIPITGTPPGGQFSGSGVIPYGNDWYFIPALPTVGTHDIVYKYRSSPESCYGYDTVTVRIVEKSAEVVLEDNRTRFCISDPPFIVTGINLVNDEIGSFSINGNATLVDHGNNTATISPSTLSVNQYTVTYTTNDGVSVTKVFDVGSALIADFSWNSECFQKDKPITFNNTSSSPYGFLTNDSYQWRLFNGSDTIKYKTSDITYKFTEPGNYNIQLHLQNSYGCVKSSEKSFVLKPVIKLAGQNYFENFEESAAWQPAKSEGTSNYSWVYGSPVKPTLPLVGFSNAYSGIQCWYTHITASPAPAELSWLRSPCFDFTNTETPAFVARIWRSFSDNRDGVNLQYSLDNGKNWNPVGSFLNDGINWFNSYFGNPGNQSLGWTAIKDPNWIEARHSLGFLKEQPSVQFRIAYSASGSAFGNGGIAIDDIGIVERNRMILIEHFTHALDTVSTDADHVLNTLVQQNESGILDLQYHTSGSPEDPFNRDNPGVPATRQFYYGLSVVPYAIINGGSQSHQWIDYEINTLNESRIVIESLYDSDFKIQVKSMIKNNTLYTETVVSALKDVPLTELSVRIAIIEPLVFFNGGENGDSIFRNVVRTMLPGAAGNTLYRTWNKDESYTLTETWPIQNVSNSESLRVVAFVQNEATKEIFQAAVDTRGIISSNNDPSVNLNGSVTIFPNPANQHAFISFGKETPEDISLEIFDTFGKLLQTVDVPRGTLKQELLIENLPSGIYLIKLTTDHKLPGNFKLMINR